MMTNKILADLRPARDKYNIRHQIKAATWETWDETHVESGGVHAGEWHSCEPVPVSVAFRKGQTWWVWCTGLYGCGWENQSSGFGQDNRIQGNHSTPEGRNFRRETQRGNPQMLSVSLWTTRVWEWPRISAEQRWSELRPFLQLTKIITC